MLTLMFARERETKNTVRFTEVVDDSERGIIGTLYLVKSQDAEFGYPSLLAVTVQPADEVPSTTAAQDAPDEAEQ